VTRQVRPWLIVLLVTVQAFVAAPSASGVAAPPEDFVAERVDAILVDLQKTGDFDGAEAQLTALLDRVIAYVHERNDEAYRELAFARRLVRQIGEVDETRQYEVLSYLREHPELARALVFLVKPEREDVDKVYALLDHLRRERGDLIDDYAMLTAAICVVHDNHPGHRINENFARPLDPLTTFDYFVAHEGQMLFGLKNVPAELLVYVVDVSATIDDLLWAVNRYAGDPMVGARFFDIQYDYEHYRTGAPKKCTEAGWGLANIHRYGGVCADQAYFAMTVGKAIGVPTAYTVGRNADTAHAWVGFLQADRKNAWWNFTTGRYSTYKGLRGVLIDPQTRRRVVDSEVSLLAAFAMSEIEDRHAVAALTDAALRLGERRASGEPFEPEPLVEANRGGRQLREATIEDQLELIEAGLRHSPGYAPAWHAVRDLAAEGALTFDQKKQWVGMLDRLCGKRFPDFTLSILAPMIETVEDVEKQNALWNSTFNMYRGRPDLAAEIRLAQAEMWLEAGKVDTAGQCYMDVINRYANAGPFVLTALREAEALLHKAGKGRQALGLYAQTWQRIKRPEQMAGQFTEQSNWYRVGNLYADRLAQFGQPQQAAQVRAILGGR